MIFCLLPFVVPSFVNKGRMDKDRTISVTAHEHSLTNVWVQDDAVWLYALASECPFVALLLR